MALLPKVGTKSLKTRFIVALIYSLLVLLGATMIVPFMITLSSSATNDMDYQRFLPIPRYFYSTSDRFMKGLVYYFNSFRGWNDQLRARMPIMPRNWTSWGSIGRDTNGIDKVAAAYTDVSPSTYKKWQIAAADYSAFCDMYPLSDMVVTIINPQGVNFIEEYYVGIFEKENPKSAAGMSYQEKKTRALELMSKRWGIPFKTFYNVNFNFDMSKPLDFQTFFPPTANAKYRDFLRLKAAYRAHYFTPGVKEDWLAYLAEKGYHYDFVHEVFPVYPQSPEKLQQLWRTFKASNAPAAPAMPFALRVAWYKYLRSEEVACHLNLTRGNKFTVATYNKLAHTAYACLEQTPFPIPASFNNNMQELWNMFVRTRFPLRLTSITVTPSLLKAFQTLLRKQVKHIRIANELLGTSNTSWEDFCITSTPPSANDTISRNRRNVWISFVKRLPADKRTITCSEIAYQKYLLEKYHDLATINATYGWDLKYIEEAFPPFMAAYAVTLHQHETAFVFKPLFFNYRVIADYLFLNARAVPVTLLLIIMTICFTLTVNPLAAYSLSRFNLRGQDKIILFMLATMAFPAMVSAIPAYLLMRDLNLLNTFWALVLPSAANGMAIFILKGFFDSLPSELFEAATIDGASEFQIFRTIAMPMVKPILAINCLNAFIIAYNGWQWALIICQDKKMWTIAVWLYQASRWWSGMPWLVSAGFVVASIPTLLVFISCQKIIMRGIIIPSMK